GRSFLIYFALLAIKLLSGVSFCKNLWCAEIYLRKIDGTAYPVLCTVSLARCSIGTGTNYVVTYIDISKRMTKENETNQQSYDDALVVLPSFNLLNRDDIAVQQATISTLNETSYLAPPVRELIIDRSTIERSMIAALDRNEFKVYFQPQIKVDGSLMGAEALVRWEHPKRGLLPPLEFISLAEETGIIIQLGLFVLEESCRKIVEWQEDFNIGEFSMSVNVSARQIRHPDFVTQVSTILKRTQADPKRLKLELTESLLVDNLEDTISKMNLLKASGVGFSLDDFGTGYSSLSYLKRLPLDQLKIDKSFVNDVLTDQNDAAIVEMILALGKSMGLAVIAEGVETEEQRSFLSERGCNAFQGYLFGRPMAMVSFETFLNVKTFTNTL
ncbi:EAL domain-containing protein, partial [Undibacterium sp. RTI2.1]|uniref:putative bifunctional diguanylate cyclase/phosphodiesterase n=1 Tax=unclassified Undibacterium TaxID=2630295 RepID=UPI002B2390D9